MARPKNNIEMFDQMVAQDSDEMNFELRREPELGTTFSKDGLDDLTTAINLFIGARLSAHFTGGPTVPGPSTMSVRVTVGLDGESWQVGPGEQPWYTTVDGERRARSVH